VIFSTSFDVFDVVVVVVTLKKKWRRRNPSIFGTVSKFSYLAVEKYACFT
jgi:hypothetical protein